MTTLLRWAFWTCALAAMAWFAFTVQLGDRTLFQHLRAIASTPEAKSLGEGARDEAAKMAERVRQGLAPGVDGAAGTGSAAGGEGGSRAGKAGRDATRSAGGDVAGKGAGDAPGHRAPADELGDEDRKALDRMVHERTDGARSSKPSAAPR